MNFLISQMRDRIIELEYEGKGAYEEARNLRFLMLETLSRLALALAIDEVTRPDNYRNYLYLSDEQLKTSKEKIKDFFSFRKDSRMRGTLGDYLFLAEELLKEFDTRNQPESVQYIRDLIYQTKKLVFPRNVANHEQAENIHLQIGERILEICDGMNELNNPYLNGAETALINIYPATFRVNSLGSTECNAMVRGAYLKGRQISMRELLRMPDDSDTVAIEMATKKDIMAPIALDESSIFMTITLPSGKTRLHLLSPLIVFLPGEKQFGIYHRRQNTWFQSSVYIRVTGSKILEEDPTWDTNMLVNVGREEKLKSIRWEGELFAHESDKKSPTYSETFTLTTDNKVLQCNINAKRFPKVGIYPGFWDVLYLDENYFNVSIYDSNKLNRLYRMFEADRPPLSNPLYVCGIGGVGKTHTVLHTLRERFLSATAMSSQSMRFRHVIFLTAKQIYFSKDKHDTAVVKAEHSDFKTCDEALKKILTVISDRERQEEKTSALIKAIRSSTQDPLLIIIDDLDSVVAPITYVDSEVQRKANYDEQRRLAEALQEIVRDNDNCRIIITTRRPLDEVGSLHLEHMNEEQSLSFARRYYKYCDPTSSMPNQYNAIIKKIGKGIPAYVMRIIYLLNHSNRFDFSEEQYQQFEKDVADFSLYTTDLNNTGVWLFKTMEYLSKIFMAIPIGLLRLILFDIGNEEVDDAMREMEKWDMIEIRNGNMIALRDDSQLLWNQLDDEDLLPKHHAAILDILLRERVLLGNFALQVGDLLIKVFQYINEKFTIDQKHSFVRRIRELISERNPFFTGITSVRQNEVEQWLNILDPTVLEKQNEKAVAVVRDSETSQVKVWIHQLQDNPKSVDALRNVLKYFSEVDALNSELCALWEQATELLPQCLQRAFGENVIDDTEIEQLLAVVDEINTEYTEKTKRDLSERFAYLFL